MLVVCSAFLSLIAAEEIIKTVKDNQPLVISIGGDRAPFSLLLPSGKPTGYYVEFWQLWSKYTGQLVEFIVSVFENTEDDLLAGKFNFHSGMFKNQKRETWADFSAPFHAVETGVYYLASNLDPINLSKVDEQKNRTVAVQLGSFQEFYIENKYQNITLIKYIEAADVFERFLSQELDIIIAEIPYMQAQIYGKGLQGIFAMSKQKLMTNKVHALVKKGNRELLNKINTGIESIPINELIALEQKWLPDLAPFFKLNDKKGPTVEQKNWLNRLPTLKVGAL